MSKFLTTNKTRPCPVCDKANGNCRIGDDKILCMSFPDSDGNSGYRYVKPAKNSLWGIHVERKDDDFDREAWEQRKAEREAREREIERQRLEKCLSPDIRDAEYRRLFAELSLSNGDRLKLLKRGLSFEEIDHGGFVSVGRYQRLRGKYHVNLPGIGKYGNCLTNSEPGFIVPVRNAYGLIVGYQVRDSEAYKWAKGAKMANGEQPLGVATPAAGITRPNIIGTGEGYLKMAIAANRLGNKSVGAAGGNFTPKETKATLEALTQGMENPLIIDYPDAGWKDNPHVARTTHRRVKLIESLGYQVTIADWGQGWDKSVGDIDEISGEAIANIRLVPPAKAFADIPSLKTKADQFADWVANQTKRFKPKGFGAPKITGNKFDGNRRDEWQRAIERGQAFLDSTLMGSGKSHTVPEITNPYGGVIWYVYGDHRNPTVEAIAWDFVDLHPRNLNGFYQDENGKIKPADKDNKATIEKGKCTRADLFPMLTNLGHNPNDGGADNPICQTCPMANVCCHTSGWYRADRRQSLKSNRIRCHIDSMPRDWDYSKDIILIDEPSQLLTPTRKITAGWKDLLLEADQIRPTLEPELWQELDRYLQVIKPLFEAKGYGLNHAEILEKLPTISPELTEAIAAYHLDLTSLFPEAMEETIADNLTREERKKWAKAIKAYNEDQRRSQSTATITNLEHLPPKALAHLLTGNGLARIQSQTLTITLDRRADYAFLNRAASIGFLDATIDGDRLQTISGLEREIKIIHNTPDKPLGNLTVRQIKLGGIGSKQVSNTALTRLHAVCKCFPDMPTIGLKAWADKLDLDGYWWRDSRGTNDFAGNAELLAIGLPNPNLGAVQDDYLAIHGNLDGFEEHYRRLVNEEILQLTGRQRANRYPDRHFTLHLVTPENADLSWLADYGITLDIKTGFEVNPEAGSQTQFTRYQIIQAILDGHTSQSAIGEAIGKTQQAISKTLKAAGATVDTLVEHLSKFLPEMATTGPYGAYTRAGCMSSELLDQLGWFFGLDIMAIAMEALAIIESEGWQGFLKYLENYPRLMQARFLAVLYSLTDSGPPWEAIT